MGVAGCGKSSVAQAVAAVMGLPLVEGDAFHPPANVDKMARGIPLTDVDRRDWLDTLARQLTPERPVVLTCSALKRVYRDRLRAAAPGLRFAFLRIDRADAVARVSARADHFFSPTLVDSQFEALEPPDGEPGVLTLEATRPVAALADGIVRWWREAA